MIRIKVVTLLVLLVAGSLISCFSDVEQGAGGGSGGSSGANTTPVAFDDNTPNTNEDNSVTITLKANDADGDNLTYSKVTDPIVGNLSAITGNSVIYTPNLNFNGNDSFTFKVNDGEADSNIATGSITINAVNDAPISVDPPATNTNEDVAVNITLIANDVENDTLTYLLDSSPSYGIVNIAGDVATYTPNANINGADSFTFKAYDGTDYSSTATVSITINPVNDAPTAVSATISVEENTTSAGVAPTVTDIDIANEGDSYTVTLLSTPTNGTASVNVSNELVYTPNAWFSGTDSFNFRAVDSGLQAVDGLATVNVTDSTPPAQVTNLAATASDGEVSLSWTNPGPTDFVVVMVGYNATGLSHDK